MSHDPIKPFSRLALLAACVLPLGLFTACKTSAPLPTSSATPSAQGEKPHPLSFQPSARPLTVTLLGSAAVPGVMTDLNLSRDGKSVLVSTSPDHDTGAGEFALTLLDRSGRKKWRITPPAQVRAQAIAEDGSLILINTYEEEIVALDPRGHELWRAPGVCRPVPFVRFKRIVCFHDDDAEPRVAFDVYDWAGKKLSSYPIREDALALKVSNDRAHFVISLDGGKAHLFAMGEGPELKPERSFSIQGEISDLALTSGPAPTVALLYATPQKKRSPSKAHLSIIKAGAKKPIDETVSDGFEQLQAAPDGSAFILYGNGKEGQKLAYFAVPHFGQAWTVGNQTPAEYSLQSAVSTDFALMGFEDAQGGQRKNHVLAFGTDGKLRADIALKTEESAYIYAQDFAPDASTLAVGTDDGRVSVYGLKPVETQAPSRSKN